jgi:hypothetical protein
MPKSKTPEQTMFPLRSTDQARPAVDRYCSLPTAADLRKRKLFGIPLCSQLTGEAIDDSSIEFYISAAISEIEHMLDIYITPVTFKEKHDYRRFNFTWNYNYLKLDHPNILSVQSVELSFSNDADVNGFVDFPLEHVHVMPQEGVIQLVPAFGTSLSGFLLSAFSGTQFHALRATGITDFPGGVRVEYTAGFNIDKVPTVICNLIETMAAIGLLSEMGPVLFPNNSVSIGIDGVSQSTSNPGPQFLTTRMAELEKEMERQLDAVKGYYQRKFLVDFF